MFLLHLYKLGSVTHTGFHLYKPPPPIKVRGNISYQTVYIEISYPNKNFYNNLTMKVIVLESITLNPNQLWKQHYYPYQWYKDIHRL